MKLSKKQHTDLSELARHFDKIEELAERMGVEIDTLSAGSEIQNNSVLHDRKRKLTIASQRSSIFKESNSENISEPENRIRLTAIVNEDRFISGR